VFVCGLVPQGTRGYVNDFAAILDDATVSLLEARLRETERDTSAEIAVVTIPSLEGMTIEEYANRLFSEWRIGKKGRNNGRRRDHSDRAHPALQRRQL